MKVIIKQVFPVQDTAASGTHTSEDDDALDYEENALHYTSGCVLHSLL